MMFRIEKKRENKMQRYKVLYEELKNSFWSKILVY